MDHNEDFQNVKNSEATTFLAVDEEKPKRLASAKKKLQDYKKTHAKSTSQSAEETPQNVNIDAILTPEPSPPLNFSNEFANNTNEVVESPDVVSCSGLFGPEIPGHSLFGSNNQPNFFVQSVDPNYFNYTVYPVRVNSEDQGKNPKKPCIPKEDVNSVTKHPPPANLDEEYRHSSQPTHAAAPHPPTNGAPMPPPKPCIPIPEPKPCVPEPDLASSHMQGRTIHPQANSGPGLHEHLEPVIHQQDSSFSRPFTEILSSPYSNPAPNHESHAKKPCIPKEGHTHRTSEPSANMESIKEPPALHVPEMSSPTDHSSNQRRSSKPGPCIPKEENKSNSHGHSDANSLGSGGSKNRNLSYTIINTIQPPPSPRSSRLPVASGLDKHMKHADATNPVEVHPTPPLLAEPCVPLPDPDLLTLTSSIVGTSGQGRPGASNEYVTSKHAASQSNFIPEMTAYEAAKLHQQAFLSSHTTSPESELELLKLRNDNKQLHQRNMDLVSQLQKLEEASTILRHEVELLQKSKREDMPSLSKMSNLIEENNVLKKTIETLSLELSKTVSDKQALEAQLQHMTDAVSVVTRDKLNLSEQLHLEREKRSLLEPAIIQKASELESSVEKNKHLERMVTELSSKLEDFMKDGQNDKFQRSIELLQAQARIVELEKELQLLKGQVDGGPCQKGHRSSRDTDDDDSRGRRKSGHQHRHHHHRTSRDYAEDANVGEKSSDTSNAGNQDPGPCTEADSSLPDQTEKLSDVEEAVEDDCVSSSCESDSENHEHCHDHDHHNHEHEHDDVSGEHKSSPTQLEKKLARLQWENVNYREELDRLAVLLKSKTVDSEALHKYQDENDRMKAELTRLEHLVVQLQSENDTIADYIALYQTQRLALKEKAREKETEMATLSQERENLRVKMEELNSLLRAYKKDDAPIEKIHELISEINTNFHPCSVCSGRLLTV